MSERNKQPLGLLIQAYVQAGWGDPWDAGLAAELGARLEPALKGRLAVLGLDSERLLDAEVDEVLAALERLELEATREDARAAAAAAADRIRVQEVNRHDTANAARGDRGVRPGRHRAPAGHGRRRQRGQR